jgi:glycerol-3-phosphate dehydrogenase (NAD(P)+)
MKHFKKIAVIGAGAWGTALARLLAGQGHEVWLWFFDAKTLAEARTAGVNPYLPGFVLADIKLTDSLEEAVNGAEVVLLANPAQHNRRVLKEAKPWLSATATLVNISKGIELDSFTLMSEMIAEVAPDKAATACYLSGPSFAKELAEEKITIVSIASRSMESARAMQKLLATDYFRPYVTDDVIGVEVAGAVKNVIAVAAGIVVGLAGGHNAKAALVTRGLAEMIRLGVAMGARAETFMGSAGLGDLFLTAGSSLSRNYSFGLALGQGGQVEGLIGHSKEVVEGYWTTKAVWHKAKELKINMAITNELYNILFNRKDPQKAMLDLMKRELKGEEF